MEQVKTLSWRQARTVLTGEYGDGEMGANQAQDVLDDLAHFAGVKAWSVRTPDGIRWLRYGGLDKARQPLYLLDTRRPYDIGAGDLPPGDLPSCGNRAELPKAQRRHAWTVLGADTRNTMGPQGFGPVHVLACVMCGADRHWKVVGR